MTFKVKRDFKYTHCTPKAQMSVYLALAQVDAIKIEELAGDAHVSLLAKRIFSRLEELNKFIKKLPEGTWED